MCLKLIFLRNVQFRTQKGFQNLRKIKTAYTKYQYLTIEKIFEELHSSIVADYDSVYLPSRESIEFLLLRMQSLSKILCRIIYCTKEATREFVAFLSKGFFIELSTLMLGILVDIWTSTIEISKQTVKYYNNIWKIHTKLKASKIEWLPKDYILPEELDKWIGDEWHNDINININDNAKTSNSLIKFLKLDTNIEADTNIVSNDVQEISVNKLLKNNSEVGMEISLDEVVKIYDIGEEVPRKKFKKSKIKSKK